MKVLSVFTSILLGASFASAAQARFCIGGELDGLTRAQVAACEQTSAALQRESQRTGAPVHWRFITVCDEAGWQTVMALQRDGVRQALRANQATDSRLHLVFVHGSQVRATDTPLLDAVLLQAAQAQRSPAQTGVRVAAGKAVLERTSLPLPASRHALR